MARENADRLESFLLGGDERCRVATDSQLNNNILVMGGTGSGKTVSVIQPILLHLEQSNAVAIYTKHGEMEAFAAFLRRRGYDVQCIDFDRPEEGQYGYDPLQYCRSAADVKDLAHAIIHAVPQGGNEDPFWPDSAENLLYVVLSFVWNGYYRRGRTMAAALELLDLLQWPIADDDDDDDDEIYGHHQDTAEMSQLFSIGRETAAARMGDKHDESGVRFRWDRGQSRFVREQASAAPNEPDKDDRPKAPQTSYALRGAFGKLKPIDSRSYGIWKSFLALPDATGACVAGSLQTPLQNVFTAEVRRILANPRRFAFENLLEPKKILFVHISPVNEAQHRFIGIFYHQLFKTLFELAEKEKTRRLPYPVHVLCDDFATGCRIDGFPQYISIFREKRLSAVMLIQSETQLTSMYNQMEAATIINNCDTLIYLGGMDVSTCEAFSRRAGRSMQELLTMPIGAEYFFRRGQKPVVTKRYDTYNDPLYAQLLRLKDTETTPVPCREAEAVSA